LHTLIWAVVLLLSESRAIINDLDVILHGFMLQIISTTVFRVEWLHNLMLHVRSFNSENRGINITLKRTSVLTEKKQIKGIRLYELYDIILSACVKFCDITECKHDGDRPQISY
jgi:hypothetical protein